MKKVLFITLYDEICYGVRLLSAVVKDCGLESHVVLFKRNCLCPHLAGKG